MGSSGNTDDATPAFLGVAQSLSGRCWRARDYDPELARHFARTLDVPEAVGRLMAARGVAADEGAAFLAPKLKDSFPDPSLFLDMDKAAGLIIDAVQKDRRITILADYDVDGATSSAILCGWFRAMGQEAGLYVPDRLAEGYGPNAKAFETIKAGGAELVITVDCGSTSHGALKAAQEMGLDVIVLDHHLLPEGAPLPPAAAHVNPNRPDDISGYGYLAAAGLAFVMLAALNREARKRGLFEDRPAPDILSFTDLAALGTICDVAQLIGFNRTIAAQGLAVMDHSTHEGIWALARVAKAKPPFGAYHAGFQMGPRINAGGRVGKSDLGARLLASADAVECEHIAEDLDRLNVERRAIEAQVQDEAVAQIEAQKKLDDILVVAGKGWHPGVIGIVSGRIKERFGRPAIIIALDENGGEGKGSGRSVSGVNLGAAFGAALKAGLLLKGGGHAMAGGLSIAPGKIDDFRTFLNAHYGDAARQAYAARGLRIDGFLSARGVDRALVDQLAKVGPFGMGNPEPVFAFADMRVAWAQELKGGHVRCRLEDKNGLGGINAIAFRAVDQGFAPLLLAGDEMLIHVAGKLKADDFRGRNSVDLRIEDVALAAKQT